MSVHVLSHRRARALAFSMGAAVAVFALLVSGFARAAAPPVTTPAPAFQRMQLGVFQVTALSDGILPLDAKALLAHVTPARLDAALGTASVSNPIPTSDNAYLVNTGAKLVLIDAGAGSFVVPTLGRVVENLRAAGYRPEDVDEIYLTHLHPDHVGGIVAKDGTPAFPHAVVRVDKREADFWLSRANRDAAPGANRPFFDAARASLAPYIASGHFATFTGSTTLTAGIRAIATPGHTPGHTSYLIESGGRRLIIWGDIVHVAAVQFTDPDVAIAYDHDQPAAIATRKRLFAMAADQRLWVADEHVSYPGLGHVVRHGSEYRWIPANYQPVIR